MGIKPGKYYAFDLDGNIARPKTRMWGWRHGREEEIDAEKYAHAYDDIRARRNGWEPHPDPKRAFRAFGPDPEFDAPFVKTLLAAEPGPAAPDFAEAVNGGHLFAVVTARGHSVAAFKEAFREAILRGLWGVNPDAMASSVGQFVRHAREKSDQVEIPRNWSHGALVDYYLDRCMWYPVSNPDVVRELAPDAAPDALKIEDLKVLAIRRIMDRVRIASSVILRGGENLTLGFSDDTAANVRTISELAMQGLDPDHPVELVVYDTAAPREELGRDTTKVLRKRKVPVRKALRK